MQGRQYMGARANNVRLEVGILVREQHIECNPKADVVDVRKTHYQSAYGKSTVVM